MTNTTELRKRYRKAFGYGLWEDVDNGMISRDHEVLAFIQQEIEAAERRRTEEVFNIMRDTHQAMEASGKSDAKFLEGHGFAVLSIREIMLEQSSKFLKNPER